MRVGPHSFNSSVNPDETAPRSQMPDVAKTAARSERNAAT
jgi:hypothetical protein